MFSTITPMKRFPADNVSLWLETLADDEMTKEHKQDSKYLGSIISRCSQAELVWVPSDTGDLEFQSAIWILLAMTQSEYRLAGRLPQSSSTS